MSVDDWAQREAERQYPALVRGEDEWYDDFEARLNERDAMADAFSGGIVHAFDALLSDEAVEAAQKEAARHPRSANVATFRVVECACGVTFEATAEGWREFYLHGPRAAIQAAVDAVTKEARND